MDVHPTKNVSIGIDPYPYYQDITHVLGYPTIQRRCADRATAGASSLASGWARATYDRDDGLGTTKDEANPKMAQNFIHVKWDRFWDLIGHLTYDVLKF